MLYQLLRRSCLAVTLGALLVVPAWHLGNVYVAAGLTGVGPWARLTDAAGLSTASPRLLGVLWSVEVFGVELLDPLAGLSLLAAGYFEVSVLIALAPPLVLVVLLGRFFCGWFCPYVFILAASNRIRTLAAGFGLHLPDRRLDRGTPFVVLLCLMLLTAMGGAVIAPLVYPPAIMGRQFARVVYFGGLGAGALVVVLAFGFDTFVSRSGFCRYLCPGGALFRLIGMGSPVRVVRDAQACEQCGDCDRVCGLGQSPQTDGLDSGCERCGKCVSACPNSALHMTVGRPRPVLFHRGKRP